MKLVREHINEKFTEKSDPIKDMSIGIEKTIQDIKDGKGVNPGEIDKWGGISDEKVAVYCISYMKNVDDVIGIIDYLFKNKRFRDNPTSLIFHALFRKPAQEALKIVSYVTNKGVIPNDIDYRVASQKLKEDKGNQTRLKIKQIITDASFKNKDKKVLSDLATMAVDLKSYEDAQKFINSGGKIYKIAARIAKAVETYDKEKFDFLSKNLIWQK